MHCHMLLPLSLAVLTLGGAWTEAHTPSSGLERGPFFVWSDQPYVASDIVGSTSRACYETASVRGFTKQVLGSLLGGATVREGAQTLLNATHLQQHNPTTVVAFVGSHIPKSGDVTALQGLQGLLDAAGSSLSFPNVMHRVAASASAEMLALLKAEHSADSVQVLGPCEGSMGAGEASAEAFKALQEGRQGASESKVVLMCSSEATPQAELQLLQAVQEVLKGSAEPHVMVYATQPFAPQAQPSKRSLLAVSAQKSQYVCDARCQTQVKLIEGIILAINLIAAVWIGSWMMHNLGTPTRFETPKEGVQRE